MKEKTITFIFMIYLTSFMIINILIPDKEISSSERRTLKSFPKINVSELLNASFGENFDTYATDQIIFRDEFRKLKNNFSFKILKNTDNNGYFKHNEHIYKINYPLNEKNINININKINKIISENLINNKVYYSVIPDKNYYLKSDKYIKIDYDKMFEHISNNIENASYIDISDKLDIKDYYKTDPHWKQENLTELASYIASQMDNIQKIVHYDKITLGTFYGSYYSQSTINTSKDEITYLTNNLLETALVNYLEDKNFKKIYNIEKSKGIDPYDLFLSGANSLIEITNSNKTLEKELIIFRDSFGSSIAPLLLPYYKKITLVDLRYINSSFLSNYINFNNQDVLFIYSTLIYNENVLK